MARRVFPTDAKTRFKLLQKPNLTDNPHGWPIDLSVKRDNKLGLPPKGHHRRCRALRRRYMDQCPQWALAGEVYCGRHLGGAKKRRKRNPEMAHNRYTKFASEKLCEIIDKVKTSSPMEAMDVQEELELSRAMLTKLVTLWDKAHHETDKDGKLKHSPELRAKANYALQNAVDHVTRTAERASRIVANMADKLPIAMIPFIADQFLTILREEVQNDELIARITERVHKMPLPDVLSKNAGAQLQTPEEQARAIRQFLQDTEFEEVTSAAS